MNDLSEFLGMIASAKAIADEKVPAVIAEAVRQGHAKSGGHKANVEIFARENWRGLVKEDAELTGALVDLWCAKFISDQYRSEGEIARADEIVSALGEWTDLGG